MRRKIRYRVVSLKVSDNFYRNLDREKDRITNELGLGKITFPDFTEMISRSGNTNLFRGGKRWKRKQKSQIY